MPKLLYPKPEPRGNKKPGRARENQRNRPYHVEYKDPDNPTAPVEWGHYNSELAVRADAWYRVKVLGFKTTATLYTRDELLESAPDLRE